MKKRRHHYVWQHYLKAWTVGGKIACLRGGDMFTPNTINVSIQTDFYRLQDFTEDDLRMVELLMRKSSPQLQHIQRAWMSIFSEAVALRCYYASGQGADLEEDEALKAAISSLDNLEEDLHQKIEDRAIYQLEALRDESLGFLDSATESESFFHFLSVQYLRTEKMKATTLAALDGITFPSFKPERVWGLLTHIFATNVAYYLSAHREHVKFSLLRAAEGTEFITSDQPLINMQAAHLPQETEPSGFEVYYPVSPRIALLLEADHPEGGRWHRVLEPEETNDYNRAILKNHYQQVFATSKEILRRLCKISV